MSKYIGRLANVGIAKESSRGTAVDATYWLPKASVSFFDRISKYKSRLSYGLIGDGHQALKTQEWAEGSLEADILDQPFGLFLLALFGTVATAGPSDSAYTHTFSLQNDNQHDSLTISVKDPDRSDRYALAMIDSLEIKVVPDDVVGFTANLVSRRGRQVGALSESYASYNKFLGRHAVVKLAAATGDLGAASALSVKSLTLRVAKNVVRDSVVGTVTPEDILNTKLVITGELELNLEDQTYRNLMLDGSYRALRFQLINTDATIGAGATNPSLKIDLSRVHFEEWEAIRPNDEIVTQRVQFHALYDVSNDDIINDVELVNGATSY